MTGSGLWLKPRGERINIDNCGPNHLAGKRFGHCLVSVPAPVNRFRNWWGPPLPKSPLSNLCAKRQAGCAIAPGLFAGKVAGVSVMVGAAGPCMTGARWARRLVLSGLSLRFAGISLELPDRTSPSARLDRLTVIGSRCLCYIELPSGGLVRALPVVDGRLWGTLLNSTSFLFLLRPLVVAKREILYGQETQPFFTQSASRQPGHAV